MEKNLTVGAVFSEGDGHKRITRSKDYLVVGGTKEEHEEVHEKVAKVSEEVKKCGEMTQEKLREIMEKIG